MQLFRIIYCNLTNNIEMFRTLLKISFLTKTVYYLGAFIVFNLAFMNRKDNTNILHIIMLTKENDIRHSFHVTRRTQTRKK